jgi:hypothetical protein
MTHCCMSARHRRAVRDTHARRDTGVIDDTDRSFSARRWTPVASKTDPAAGKSVERWGDRLLLMMPAHREKHTTKSVPVCPMPLHEILSERRTTVQTSGCTNRSNH